MQISQSPRQMSEGSRRCQSPLPIIFTLDLTYFARAANRARLSSEFVQYYGRLEDVDHSTGDHGVHSVALRRRRRQRRGLGSAIIRNGVSRELRRFSSFAWWARDGGHSGECRGYVVVQAL